MKIRQTILASAIALATLGVSAASATTNLALNGSFETPGAPGDFLTLSNGSTYIADWTVGGDSIDYIGTYWAAADGNYSLDMNGLAPGSISQTLNGLTVGQSYNVSFDLAGNPAGGPTLKTMDVDVGGPLGDSVSFSVANTNLGSMGWTGESFRFTATSTSEALDFVSTTTGFSGNDTYPSAFGPALDNVSVTAVPEPATWAMLLAGFFSIGFMMRGSRRKDAAVLA